MKKDLFEKRIESVEELDFESKENLVGFFALLQKIDMRVNPELYKKKLSTNNKK